MSVVMFLGVVACVFILRVLHWVRGKGQSCKLVVVSALALISATAYGAIYLPESYYHEEFERIARVPFPAGGDVVYSDRSTSADSAYRSCAVFTVSEEAYRTLKQTIAVQHSDGIPDSARDCLAHSEQRQGNRLNFVASSEFAESAGAYELWGLLDDGRSALYFTMRWKDRNPV